MKGVGLLYWCGDCFGLNVFWGEILEEQVFEEFNVLFVDLLNCQELLMEQEMDLFVWYVLQLIYLFNLIVNLDNSLSNWMCNVYDVYNNDVNDMLIMCNGCYVIDFVCGWFGIDGIMVIEGGGVEEDMKIFYL